MAAGSGIVRNSNDVTTPRVPAPAPERPEQVVVVVLVAADDPAIGQDDPCADQSVGGRPCSSVRGSRARPRASGPRSRPRDRCPPGWRGRVRATLRTRRRALPPRRCSRPLHRPTRTASGRRRSAGRWSRTLPRSRALRSARRVLQAVSSDERDGLGDILGARTSDDAQRPDLVEPSVERPARALVALGVGEPRAPAIKSAERLPIGRHAP